ncbi:MAG: hypothetical protein KH230_20335 [Enterocloster asparagiformis]|nr:hypothetical protein [Enterocloster asparagiformis]
MKDERIMQSMNKIWGEIGRLTYYLAVASFVVKVLIGGFKMENWIVEYVIMIGAPVYQFVRMRQLKLAFGGSLKKRGYWKRELIVMLVVVAVYLLVMFTRTEVNVKEALISLVAFIVSFQAIRALIVTLEGKRTERLEKEFEEDEQEDSGD